MSSGSGWGTGGEEGERVGESEREGASGEGKWVRGDEGSPWLCPYALPARPARRSGSTSPL